MLDTDGKAASAVDAEIVNRVCDAIDILKQGTTEQERLELRILLAAVAHRKKEKENDPRGWGRKICKRLNINRNGKPYRDSVTHRAGIDAEYAKRKARRNKFLEFEVGDEVVCKDGAGTPPTKYAARAYVSPWKKWSHATGPAAAVHSAAVDRRMRCEPSCSTRITVSMSARHPSGPPAVVMLHHKSV